MPTLEERLAKARKGTLEQRLARAQAANPFTEELNRRNPFTGELNRRELLQEEKELLLRKKALLEGGDIDKPENAGSAFADAASREFINSLLGLPQASGTALAFTAALPALVPGGETFRKQFETEKGKLPASLLRSIPRPTVEGISAGARSLPALLPGGETFGERKERIEVYRIPNGIFY